MRTTLSPLKEDGKIHLCMPLSIIDKVPPEDAGRLFDRFFRSATEEFGEYPAFEFEKREEKGVLLARARGPAGDVPKSEPSEAQ